LQNILYAIETLIYKLYHNTTLKAPKKYVRHTALQAVVVVITICATCSVISHMKCVCTFLLVLSEAQYVVFVVP
jgi:uncharacterized protein YcgI (DUF1989 family)